MGDYAFTTLAPQLGVVPAPNPIDDPIVIADIPGLIEGAHEVGRPSNVFDRKLLLWTSPVWHGGRTRWVGVCSLEGAAAVLSSACRLEAPAPPSLPANLGTPRSVTSLQYIQPH